MIEERSLAIRPVDVRVAPDDFDDWEAVHALLKRCFAYMDARIDPPSSLHTMQSADLAKKSQHERVAIAEHDGQIIGCGFLSLRPKAIYLGKIAVSPEYRGQGILRSIIGLADEMARALGRDVLELETRIELIENHMTFEALGFSQVAQNSHPGFNRPTSITMQRRVPGVVTDTGSVTLPLNRHNGGPPLDDPDGHVPPWGKNGFRSYFGWKKAHRAAWKVSPAIAKRRARQARACGVTYEEYTSLLLDTGRHLQPGDTELIAAIMARR